MAAQPCAGRGFSQSHAPRDPSPKVRQQSVQTKRSGARWESGAAPPPPIGERVPASGSRAGTVMALGNAEFGTRSGGMRTGGTERPGGAWEERRPSLRPAVGSLSFESMASLSAADRGPQESQEYQAPPPEVHGIF